MGILLTYLQKINKTTIHTAATHSHTNTNNLKSKNEKLLLTLTGIITYEIWSSRNNLKYDKTHLPKEIMIRKIIT